MTEAQEASHEGLMDFLENRIALGIANEAGPGKQK